MGLKPVAWLGQDANQHDHCYPKHKTIEASPDVLAEGFWVVRVGDAVAPHGGSCSRHRTPHGARVQAGSASVFVNGKPLAREGDQVRCDTGQTAPLLRGRATVVAGDESPVAKAGTRSTVESDRPTVSKPDTGTTGVGGDDPQAVVRPGTGATEVAGDGPRVAGLGTGMSLAGLPPEVRVSPELCKLFNEHMANSLVDGKTMERGGVLVRDEKTGEVSMYVGNVTSTPGALYVDRNVPAGQKILGVFHTHPYAESEGGYTDVSLSGGDAGLMINMDDEMMFAQSGEGQFMYLRTADTPAQVDHIQLNAAQNARLGALMTTGKRFDEASRIAARETAEKYHLAYYEGKKGVLLRIYP